MNPFRTADAEAGEAGATVPDASGFAMPARPPMSPFEPTPEELAALRAQHGAALRVSGPIGPSKARFAVRAFDAATFDRYYDESLSTPETAIDNALKRHLVWPAVDACARLTMATAAIPSLIVRAMEESARGAGSSGPAARLDALEATTSDAVLAGAGLDRASAEKLIAQAAAGGIALELVTLRKGGGLVLRAPEPVIYEQIMSAMRAKRGVALAARTAAIACTAWASEDAAGLFTRLPGLAAQVVLPALLRLGGAGAENSFCFDD